MTQAPEPKKRPKSAIAAGAPAGRRPTRDRSEPRPKGRQEVRQALLDAAQRLFAERGPGNVTLREIAEEAGVNFGLVYQYVGARDELLRQVYQEVATRSAVRLEPIDHVADAIAALMTVPDRGIARIMAWAVLEGDYPGDVLGPSPALEHIAGVIAGESRARADEGPADAGDAPGDDDRLLAAFLMVAAMGWRLFKAIGLTSAGLDATPDPERDEKVTQWLQLLAAGVLSE